MEVEDDVQEEARREDIINVVDEFDPLTPNVNVSPKHDVEDPLNISLDVNKDNN